MTRSTLFFLLGVFLYAGFVTGCGEAASEASLRPETKEALALLPADAGLVARLDVEGLRQSDLIASLPKNPFSREALEGAGNEKVEAFIDATGFNPSTDLEALYLAIDTPGADPLISVVMKARYDTPRLQAFLNDALPDDVDRTLYRGVTIYRHHAEPFSLYMALAGGDVLLAANRETEIHAMLDRLEGTLPGLADDTAATRLIAAADEGQAWALARGLDISSLPTDNAPQAPAELLRLGRAVSSLAVSGRTRDESLEGTVTLVPREDVSPDDLADLVRGLIGVARARPELTPAMLHTLDGIDVSESRGLVRITGRVERQLLADHH